ncbi:Methyltransferase (modular protein) [uncultured Gammaproteobacteria bacterium]
MLFAHRSSGPNLALSLAGGILFTPTGLVLFVLVEPLSMRMPGTAPELSAKIQEVDVTELQAKVAIGFAGMVVYTSAAFQVLLANSAADVSSEVAYVWHSAVHARVVAESLEVCGFVIRSQIIWAKSRFALGRGDYHWQHEPCLYAVRKDGTGHWQGARDQATVWSISNGDDDQATVHGTQKPVACMRRPIENNSAKGDCVYEPFSGSGTTLIAAERTNRHCFALELDPRYVDVAVRRW